MTENNTLQNEGYKQTELGPLPQEWKVARLVEVCEKMRAGGTPRTNIKEYWENGRIPLVKVEDVVNASKFLLNTNLSITEKGLKESSAWLVPTNSIILSMYGTAGEVCINKIAVAVTQNVLGIITKQNIITEYLYYALKYAKIYTLYLISERTIFNHFSLSKAKNLLLPLPPLHEQKKIAYVLSVVQEAEEKTDKYIQALKELKKSAMKHLFTYGAVPFDETDKVELKETEIGKIPEEWEVVRLGEVGSFQYGFTESASENKIGPHFLRITDIDLNYNKINWSYVPYCKIKRDDYSKYVLKEGDILIARIGATTGKTCIVKKPPVSVFASYLIRFKTDNAKLLQDYTFYYTKSVNYWNQINANKEGKLKKGINSSQLKNFQIPLPSLPEQQRIASILSNIDEQIEAMEYKKKAIRELFNSLLKNLMTAKIRVNNLEINKYGKN